VSWQWRLTTFGPRSRSSNPAIQMSCTRRHPRTTRTDTEGHGGCEGRIVVLGAELFAMSAAVAYAQTAMREPHERVAETQELAEAFCNQAQHRAERLFQELWSNAARPTTNWHWTSSAAGTPGWRRGSSTVRRRRPDGPVGRDRPGGVQLPARDDGRPGSSVRQRPHQQLFCGGSEIRERLTVIGGIGGHASGLGKQVPRTSVRDQREQTEGETWLSQSHR
jgi:hypothetical protein